MLPSLVDDRMTQLPRAVRPEVEEDHAVAVGDGRSGITVRWHDPGRLEEVVVDSPGIALRNEGDGVGRRRSLGLDDRAIGAFRPIPTLVAVHRVVAAADARDAAGPDSLNFVDPVLHVSGGAARR